MQPKESKRPRSRSPSQGNGDEAHKRHRGPSDASGDVVAAVALPVVTPAPGAEAGAAGAGAGAAVDAGAGASTVAAVGAAASAQEEEKMRRREKLRAWQEAKRLAAEKEATGGPAPGSASVPSSASASASASTSAAAAAATAGPASASVESKDDSNGASAAPKIPPASDAAAVGAAKLGAPFSPVKVSRSRSNSITVFSAVGDTSLPPPTSASASASASASTSASAFAPPRGPAKRRFGRLKVSKWDAEAEDETDAGAVAGAGAGAGAATSVSAFSAPSASSASAPSGFAFVSASASAGVKGTGAFAPSSSGGAVSSTGPASAGVGDVGAGVASVDAGVEGGEGEDDPLEAFMSSLYGGGDVTTQKGDQERVGAGGAVAHSITMDEIMGLSRPQAQSQSPGSDTQEQEQGLHSFAPPPPSGGSVSSLRSMRRSERDERKGGDERKVGGGDKGDMGGRDNGNRGDSPGTSPSSAISSRSPSVSNMADMGALNRGWESDAAEGEGYMEGDMMDEDMGMGDGDGEALGGRAGKAERDRSGSAGSEEGVPWDLLTPQQRHEALQVEAGEEDEEVREARETREKREFMEAMRKARAEEDRVRDRLAAFDAERETAKAPGSGSAGSGMGIGGMGAGVGTGGGGAGAGAGTMAAPTLKPKSTMGRIFQGDGDMVEEAEGSKKRSALEILEEAKKGKQLREVDHAKMEYAAFRKNLYIVPRLLRLPEERVAEMREDLHVKVRGKGCPAPVESWEQCGLSDRILQVLSQNDLKSPFAIQRQAIPAIMCGRDVIGVAKTGSGKTLAFLLPMLRHILDQPPLLDGEGPIGLVMAPSRELAYQIYSEAKKFSKPLGLRVTCIYGGAGVAEQIADLKRGSEIVVCTPGRMIDILCMQAGKLVSLRRVTMVVMDEADRMFDMGFEPQIRMITQNVRPDRQTVLFSATFPKQIEKLARAVLKLPLEIVVGERSTVNKDITQIIEVHEEEDKFLRLLQLLGVWYEKGSVLIFVDKQEKCDQLYADLLKLGYPCLSLHGGKDQVDRDHTLHEFKTGVKTVMVATSVAGRGLDVPDIVCVINYHCPNHMEDYVHRVGRTGRAGRKGTAYTFVSQKEEQYAPSMAKLLTKAGVAVPPELASLVQAFKDKVSRGEAQYATSGFDGKGFSFDAGEMNAEQKVASMQKRLYEKEQGLDADEEEEEEDTQTTAAALAAAALAKTGGAAAAAPAAMAPPAPVVTADMTPLERARALAAQFSRKADTGSAGGGVSVSGGLGGGVSVGGGGMGMGGMGMGGGDAVARAKAIALQMTAAAAGLSRGGGSTSTGAEPEQHFSDELEINDYPPQARRKITNKNAIDDVIERTGVAIIARGSYIPPGKKLEAGERRLHLLIEGTSAMSVKQARLEIVKVLEDETIRISASGSLATTGRYSVL